MNILIDMNLPPSWQKVLEELGFKATHWLNVGAPTATDSEILNWAKNNKHIIFTHDLDFGALLAISRSGSPSVIQIRTQNTLPEKNINMMIQCLKEFKIELEKGALIVIDEKRSRIRILPLND